MCKITSKPMVLALCAMFLAAMFTACESADIRELRRLNEENQHMRFELGLEDEDSQTQFAIGDAFNGGQTEADTPSSDTRSIGGDRGIIGLMLSGTWIGGHSSNITRFIFSNGEFVIEEDQRQGGGGATWSNGTFSVSGNEIEFVFQSGRVVVHEFSHFEDTIIIGNQEFTRNNDYVTDFAHGFPNRRFGLAE